MRKLPSYPLFVKDPFFQLWMPDEEISDFNAKFYTDKEIPLIGLIKHKDSLYRFVGKEIGEKMDVVNIELTATTTIFELKNDLFKIKLYFISPLLLDDLKLLSNPTCILRYEIETSVEDYEVIFGVSSAILSNTPVGELAHRGGTFRVLNKSVSFFGLNNQNVLSISADAFGPEHGYWYITADNTKYVKKELLLDAILGKETKVEVSKDEHFIYGVNHESGNSNNYFLFSFDDIASIYYYGEVLRGYYFKDGATIVDAIKETIKKYNLIIDKCSNFDDEFDKRNGLSKEFLNIAYGSYRQSIAGFKLVENHKRELLFISKEISSNGCLATVDISYPAAPLYLLYNPKLVKAMLTPVFTFAKSKVWKYNFAPHDCGVYPYAIGQVYGLLQPNEVDNKSDLSYGNNECNGVLPFVYLFDDGDKVYKNEMQMPIEECANMIILTYLACLYDKKFDFAKEHYSLLKKWALYLYKAGLIPVNQLCTDDFCGQMDGNVNLAIKATCALKYFSLLSKKLHKEEKNDFMKEAKQRAKTISTLSKKSLPFSFYSKEDSFSLKYNLICDYFDGPRLFEDELINKEIDFYLEKVNMYGVPLDSGNTFTKADWLLFVAALTEYKDKQSDFFTKINKFLVETPDRDPFSDWYETDTGKRRFFKARPVIGGNFMPVLIKELIGGKKHEINKKNN